MPTKIQGIVEEETARALIGAVSFAVQRAADAIAAEMLAEPGFREAIKTMAREAAQAILADLAKRQEPAAR